MNRFLLVILTISLTFSVLHAQDDFSDILSELEQKIQDKGDDEIEDSWEVIKPRISALDDTQKKGLGLVLKSMKSARLSLNPYYKSFFKAYATTANPDLQEDTYDQWIRTLNQMLGPEQSNRANKIKEYLQFSATYFKDRSLRASAGGTNWKTDSYHIELGFKEDKPFIKFDEVTLLAYSKKDSMLIEKTSGTYLPLASTWLGDGGKASWPEGELGSIYADFGKYTLDTKKGLYDVAEATLTFEKYFEGRTIMGKFQDKLSNEVIKNHPSFISKDRDLVVNDLGPNLSLRGGIELRGEKLFSTGIKENPAAMQLRDESGTILFKLGALSFGVQKTSEIVGKRMSATLYFDQDSLYHPSVNVKYNPTEKTLRIFRGDTALDAVPFYDSYHNFNLQVDEIKWYIVQDSLVYGEQKRGITSDLKSLYFESPDYFSEREFGRIQSISSTNPIIILKMLSEQNDSRFIEALAVAKKINPKYSLGSAQTLFYDLVESGFINYDKDLEIIEVRDKVFHYADASRNRIDFDRLRISSKTSENNATVNTATNEMIVSNVKSVELSPIHRVAIIPKDRKLRIIKNRSMKMDGNMFAGLASFEGKGFYFDYDKFLVKIDSVNYLDFFVLREDGTEPEGLASRLENGNGTLLIDAPGNKSGQEKIPLFPSFTSDKPFSVFYDKAQDSSYDRSSFYFQLDKFGFNSLDSFGMEEVQFKGKLFSEDIFEPFEEKISIQEDFSLGFISSTGAAGRQLYKSKGQFNGDINLNNIGLLGIGQIQYLQSDIKSDDIVFRPALLSATSTDMAIDQDSKVPKVIGKDLGISWSPYLDTMTLISQEMPFALFQNEQASLSGTMFLGPFGLSGTGDLEFDQGNLVSNGFKFSSNGVKADTSNLQIKAADNEELAFETKNVSGEIDFDKSIARFKANSSEISTSMPYNKYKTSMNEFTWDIQNKTVSFTAQGASEAYFLSTDSEQDSLIFAGQEATYNIAQSTLEVGGVEKIEVGDAIIETLNGKVDVEPGGKMKTLEDATIYVDKVQKQHVIKNASVDISSKHAYAAKGEYAYDLATKKQSVVLNNIIGQLNGKGKKTEQVSITKALGEIVEADNFYIDEKTKFIGSMSLTGDSKDLLFKGFAQLDAPHIRDKSWFSVNSLGNKEDLHISYDKPKSKDGEPIRTGIFLSKESALAYPSVMQPLSFRKDRPIIDTKGQFKYDKGSETFIFGDSLKIQRGARKGSILKYNNATAEIEAEGVMQLCPKVQPFIPMKTVGRVTTKFKTKTPEQKWSEIPEPEVKAYVMSSISLPIPKAMMDQMAVDFKSSTFDATKPTYAGDDFYEYALSEFTKKQSQYVDALKYREENVIEIPKSMDKSSFIIGKMEMKWDPDYQSFVSKPGKVPLINIDGSPINIMVDAHIEYKMTTSEDDRLYIYLKSPSGLFYFFGFQGEVLNITSDNARFMGPLNDMKDKDRIIDISKTLSFELQGVTEGTANKFIERSRAAW